MLRAFTFAAIVAIVCFSANAQPSREEWGAVPVVVSQAAKVWRYLRGPSAGGRRIDRAGKRCRRLFAGVKLISGIGFMLPDGVHLGTADRITS